MPARRVSLSAALFAYNSQGISPRDCPTTSFYCFPARVRVKSKTFPVCAFCAYRRPLPGWPSCTENGKPYQRELCFFFLRLRPAHGRGKWGGELSQLIIDPGRRVTVDTHVSEHTTCCFRCLAWNMRLRRFSGTAFGPRTRRYARYRCATRVHFVVKPYAGTSKSGQWFTTYSLWLFSLSTPYYAYVLKRTRTRTRNTTFVLRLTNIFSTQTGARLFSFLSTPSPWPRKIKHTCYGRVKHKK